MKKEETLASFLWFQFSSYHDEKKKTKKKYSTCALADISMIYELL
jgi:hypothetical protein